MVAGSPGRGATVGSGVVTNIGGAGCGTLAVATGRGGAGTLVTVGLVSVGVSKATVADADDCKS